MQTTDAYVGPPVDIWSCGVILYIMVGGAFPFVQADHSCELYVSLAEGRFQFPEQFSPELKDILLKMFTINPAERITLAGIEQHPWFDPDALHSKDPILPVDAGAGMAIDDGMDDGLYAAPVQEEPLYRTLDPEMMSCDAPGGFQEEPVYRSVNLEQQAAAPMSSKEPCSGFGCKPSCHVTSQKAVGDVFSGIVSLLEKNFATVSAKAELGSIHAEIQGASGKAVKVAIKVEQGEDKLSHVFVKRIEGHGLDYCAMFKKMMPLLNAECA